MRVRWSYVLPVIILLVLGALACDLPGGGKPTVVINSPPSNFEIGEGEQLAVEVSSTGGGSIDRVELWVDNALVNVATNPAPQQTFNARLTWGVSGVGQHTVQVRAYNTGGQASDPAVILVIVTQGVAEATPTGEVEPSATPEEEATATPTKTLTPPMPTPTVTPTVCPGPPVIPSFTADHLTITAGESSTLSWGLVTNASSASIDQGIGGVGTPGSVVVTPATTTTYTMSATGCGGTATSQVTITVNPAGPADVYNLFDHMCDATWSSSAAATLDCPGHGGDDRGFELNVSGQQLEDASTPSKVIETFPPHNLDGAVSTWIQGKYHLPWSIQSGDRFVAKVGFLGVHAGGSVKFMLTCSTNGSGGTAWQNTKSYNGSLVDVSVDISDFCGAVPYISLRLLSNGLSANDIAVWVNPHIEGMPR